MKIDRHKGNATHTRFIVEMPFGIALYAGSTKNGTFTGWHEGCVATWEEGEAWLDHKPVNRIIVYPDSVEFHGLPT